MSARTLNSHRQVHRTETGRRQLLVCAAHRSLAKRSAAALNALLRQMLAPQI